MSETYEKNHKHGYSWLLCESRCRIRDADHPWEWVACRHLHGKLSEPPESVTALIETEHHGLRNVSRPARGPRARQGQQRCCYCEGSDVGYDQAGCGRVRIPHHRLLDCDFCPSRASNGARDGPRSAEGCLPGLASTVPAVTACNTAHCK